MRKHLYGAAQRDCDHWHEGPGFVTSHMALTMEFEQSFSSEDIAASMSEVIDAASATLLHPDACTHAAFYY